jgi:hypothetical protein
MRRLLVVLVVLALLGAGGYAGWRAIRHHTASTTTTSSAPTTTTTMSPIAPLTGLPDPGGGALTRPAMTVKIENTPEAMPQRGIDQADDIYEEICEGGITRLAAIFNSQVPSVVGPIRSVRRTDHSIVWPLGGLFVYSGGAAYAVRSIDTAPVHTEDETTAGDAMFRDDNGRIAPNNLYGWTAKLFALGGTPVPPAPLFTYRRASASVGGVPVKSFIVGFGAGYTVSYNWNATTSSWNRYQFQAPDKTWNGTWLSPKNVIVMDVQYQGGVGELGSQAVMVGTGTSYVFTDGHEIAGTWQRSSLSQPAKYLNHNGQVIALTPGQTWVELLYVGDPLTVTPVPPAATTTSSPSSTNG